MNHITYKKIPKTDEIRLRQLIETVISELENPDFFIPYEEWEYEKMFDEDYAPLYGAYDKDQLIAMAQLYVDESMLKEYVDIFGLQGCKTCELGGAMCLKEYRKQGIITNLINILKRIATEQGYDYMITMAHPDNIASNKTIEKIGLPYIKTAIVNETFLRKLYSMKIEK